MRRLPAILLSLFVASVALASTEEPGLRALDPAMRLGRAMILHPSHPLDDADRAALAEQGIHVKHALAEGRYLARVKDDADVTAVGSLVSSIEPLTAEKKLHASALREARPGKSWARVNVVFQEDVSFEDARDAIVDAGGALLDPFALEFTPSQRLEAKIAPVALTALASDERVLAVAGPIRWRVASDNADSAVLSHVTELRQAPYGLTGEGVNVSLFELAAAQQDHVELAGRFTVVASGGPSSDKAHATHVAGTIGASGVLPGAMGMAPKARIWQHCVDTPANECNNDWLKDKQNALSALGISVDNNSWGYVLAWTTEGGYPVWLSSDQYLGAYDLIVGAPLDKISNEKGILFVHSAGNDADGASFSTEYFEHRHVDDNLDTITDKVFCYSVNGSGSDCPAGCNGGCEKVRHDPKLPYDTIGVTAGAKNILTVGAVATSGQGVSIVNFSSRGPAKDGRIKPEVVARGWNVLSSVPTNNYTRLNGTSMAAPAVTGIAALLVEHWRKTFSGTSPTPAQLKAVIIAGTDDYGNPGPDYTFGFGLVNAKNSADLITADAGRGQRIRTLSFTQGQTHETTVVVSEQQNLRIVLNWPDPPIAYLGGDDIAAKAIVNDLDVKVIDPSGVEHLPWVLDAVNYQNNATRGVNSVDVTEMVEIPNAAPGTYRVVATGKTINEGPQTAVLVTSARTAAPCTDPIELVAANDTPGSAFGNIVPGQQLSGGLCTANDVDYYKFNVTKSGPVSVTVTTGDTPLRVTLSGNGVNQTIDVAAGSSGTINANVSSVPLPLTLKIEANGARGAEPQYFFVTSFGETHQPRRRSVGK